jgi:hypothetical protein
MSKTYKIILVLILAFLALGIGFLIYANLSKEPQSNNPNPVEENLPDYILPSDEEARVKEFVKNFVNLYNTYSYADYSNLKALGDYQDTNLQSETLDLINSLDNTVKPGFAKETKVDINSFSYKYPRAKNLQVNLTGEASESQDYYPTGQNTPTWKKYPIEINLELIKYNQNWLVSQIKISKK